MSVKYGILTLLYSQKNHGYELKLELESLLGTKGKINAGQIYTTLDRLIRDQLVLSVGMDDQERKLYEITAEGKKNWKIGCWNQCPIILRKTTFILNGAVLVRLVSNRKRRCSNSKKR